MIAAPWIPIRVGHSDDAPTVYFTPSATCPPTVALDVQRQLALPIDRKAPARARTAKQGAAARDKAGEARLTAIAKLPADLSRAHVARIVYESEGGDLIAVDSDPLTSAQAHALASDCNASHCAAIGAQVLPWDRARKDAPGASVIVVPKYALRDAYKERRTARLIALPHQIANGVIRCEYIEPVMEFRFAA